MPFIKKFIFIEPILNDFDKIFWGDCLFWRDGWGLDLNKYIMDSYVTLTFKTSKYGQIVVLYLHKQEI